MDFTRFAEAGGGGFGSEVALWGGEEFVADHKLANGGGPQKRREIMRVKMPGFVRLAVGWPLMKTHGIGKGGFEQIVVTNGDAAKDVAEKVALVRAELIERRDVTLTQDERFERPDGPEGHHYSERIVLANDALVSLQL